MAGPFLIARNGVVIGAPPRRVFDYLADMSRHAEWNPDPGFRVTTRPDGPVGVGSLHRRERTGEMQGPIILRGGMGDSLVTVVKIMTITAYEPYRSLAFETRNSFNGLLHSADLVSFGLQSTPEGTRVTMVSEVESMVPSAFIGPVYAIRMARALLSRALSRWGAGFFSEVTVGPHLSRVKERVEAGEIARRI